MMWPVITNKNRRIKNNATLLFTLFYNQFVQSTTTANCPIVKQPIVAPGTKYLWQETARWFIEFLENGSSGSISKYFFISFLGGIINSFHVVCSYFSFKLFAPKHNTAFVLFQAFWCRIAILQASRAKTGLGLDVIRSLPPINQSEDWPNSLN